jgi:protein involved in polysaccharide export with SLBB domain
MNTRFFALALAAALAAGACAKPVDPNYLALLHDPSEAPSANLLGAGDKLALRVYNEEHLGGEFVVAPEGSISVPLIGKVEVTGLTCARLEDLLVHKLQEGYLQKPSVTCSVLEYNSKKVFVFGEVNKPGNFRFVEEMSVVQAISEAGGLSERASADNTTLVRVVQGEKVKVRVPVEAIMAGEVENLPLLPGDILVIPETIY